MVYREAILIGCVCVYVCVCVEWVFLCFFVRTYTNGTFVHEDLSSAVFVVFHMKGLVLSQDIGVSGISIYWRVGGVERVV